jgi:ComF family protein
MFRGLSTAVNLQGLLGLTKAGARHGRSAGRNWLGNAGWRLAPGRCVLCGGAGAAPRLDLCRHCLATLPAMQSPHHVDTHGFDLLVHPWHYAWPVDAMLRGLKFGGELVHARVLGTLLARCRGAHAAPLPGVIMPIPLHPMRYAERGFNQARELAGAAAGELGLRLETDRLIRLRNTKAQSSLDKASRRHNMHLAFACPAPPVAAAIALVDDVMTTGATAAAAASALRAAGAARVELWVAARVVREP